MGTEDEFAQVNLITRSTTFGVGQTNRSIQAYNLKGCTDKIVVILDTEYIRRRRYHWQLMPQKCQRYITHAVSQTYLLMYPTLQ